MACCPKEKRDDDEIDTCCGPETGGPLCVCLPYNDGFVIAAQVISIVAFLLSWVWWVTFIISAIGMTLLQVTWCCRQTKTTIWSSVITGGISAIMCLFSGIWVLVVWKDARHCHAFYFDYYYNDDWAASWDYCEEGTWASIAFVDTVLWITVTVLLLYFVCSGRHQKWENKLGKKSTATGGELLTVQGTTAAGAMEEAKVATTSIDGGAGAPQATVLATSADSNEPTKTAEKIDQV